MWLLHRMSLHVTVHPEMEMEQQAMLLGDRQQHTTGPLFRNVLLEHPPHQTLAPESVAAFF